MSTSLSGLTTNFFPKPQNGFTTTTSGSVTSGAATVGLNSVAGYSNGDIGAWVIDPTDATKKQTFTGVVDTGGSQITSVVWTAGTNQNHLLGATVVDYATATHMGMVSKGILTHADQDGTLKAGAVDVAAVLASGVVTNAKLSTTAGELGGAWQSWTPTWTSFTVSSSTVVAKYVQIGKMVHCRISVVTAGGNAPSGDVDFTLPVTAATYAGSTNLVPLGTVSFLDTSIPRIFKGDVCMSSSTKAVVRAMATDLSFLYHFALSSTAPMTWANGDEMSLQFVYEAA